MWSRAAATFRWFTSQMAVTRTSGCERKFRMSYVPWAPTPITPRVSLSDGAGWPAEPSTCAGTNHGAAPAASVALRKPRRVTPADIFSTYSFDSLLVFTSCRVAASSEAWRWSCSHSKDIEVLPLTLPPGMDPVPPNMCESIIDGERRQFDDLAAGQGRLVRAQADAGPVRRLSGRSGTGRALRPAP